MISMFNSIREDGRVVVLVNSQLLWHGIRVQWNYGTSLNVKKKKKKEKKCTHLKSLDCLIWNLRHCAT